MIYTLVYLIWSFYYSNIVSKYLIFFSYDTPFSYVVMNNKIDNISFTRMTISNSLFSSTLPSACLLPLLEFVFDSLSFFMPTLLSSGGFLSLLVLIDEISSNHYRVFLQSNGKHFCSRIHYTVMIPKQTLN